MRNTKVWIPAVVLAVLVAAACSPSPAKPAPNGPGDGSDETGAIRLTPSEFDRLRHALIEWFECEECTEGQLEAVVAFGEKAVPSLVATLEEGPSPSQREELRRALAKSWSEMERHQRTAEIAVPGGEAGLPGSREEYLETYLENYVALYRVRAARALATIGGERAEQALRAAVDRRHREDVAAAVREALEKLQQR